MITRTPETLFCTSIRRNNSGYSVVAATAFAVVAGTWLLVLTNIAYPQYRKAVESRYYSTVRSAAEAGLDYVVAQLNTAISSGTTSSFDDSTADGTPRVTVLPASFTGNAAATVTVSVNSVAPTASSSVYATNLDPVATPSIVQNYWRVVEATAAYAGLNVSVRVVVRPIAVVTTSNTPTPFFQNALFSQGLLSASGNMVTDAYDSRNGAYGGANVNAYNGHVGSNTGINLSGNTTIGGNVVVASLPKASTTTVVATRSGNATIKNQLKVNGITTGFTATDGAAPGGSDHVKALEFGTPRTGDYTTPIDRSLTTDQFILNTAPSSPPGSYDVGAVSISGNATVIVKVGAPAVTSINVSGNNTLYIPPGNYKASSISISGNGQLQVQNTVSTNTVFYMEGNTAGANVVQIGGNGVANNTAIPAKFQIMTNSSKNVLVSGNGNFYGVIYAPSANMTVSGNGTVYGAAVAKTITSSGNANFHFDMALKDATYAGQNGLGYTVSSPGTTVINGLQTVSWEER